MNVEKMTNEEIKAELDEIYNDWFDNHTLFSLTDFEDLIVEITKREIIGGIEENK